jgi:hypothetical protein
MSKQPATGKNVRKKTRKRPLTAAQRAKYPRMAEAMRGNTRALIHGHASTAVRHADLPELAYLKTLRQQEVEAFIADLGGVSEITAAQRSAIESLMQLHNVRDYVTAHVLKDGILTQAGRTRAAVNTLLATADRIERYLKLIGLERKAKKVGDLETFLSTRRNTTPVVPVPQDDEEDD